MLQGQIPMHLPLALGRRGRPPEPIERSAAIEGPCRWELYRSWGEGPRIVFAGLNPSNADGRRDDPTMLREMGFAWRWGYGSLVKINIYPFITSSPVELRKVLAVPAAEANAFRRNADTSAGHLRSCGMAIAAWGNGADQAGLKRWLDAIERELGGKVAWHCLGTNRDGSPKHTLARGHHRVPDDAIPRPWSPPC
jgi:hypothetical protein